jgi:uncharacterized protein YndB with AHSA1/START domain
MVENVITTIHATLEFERVIAAPPAEVFKAYADVKTRAAWSTPSETAVVIYDEADFRPGGTDRFRCGAKTDPNIHGTTHYHVIELGHLLAATETLDMNGQRLCAALNTITFIAEGAGTRLKHIAQIASFIGEGMIKGHADGNAAALDNLVRFFE